MIKADLHTHTSFSDGKYSPRELVCLARNAGFSYLAVTDHDNIDSVDEAIETGKKLGIEIIPGVEISAEYDEREIHILGYFINTKNKTLREYLKYFKQERKSRAVQIVEKLNCLGVPLSFAAVTDNNDPAVSLGRPHIARALLKGKYIDAYHTAFAKYIGEGKPAFVKKPNISPSEAVKLISDAGGISFIAHPGKTIRDNILLEIIRQGLDGIETVHPSHSSADVAYFQKVAARYFLLESGGSDFHGTKPNEENNYGTYFIPEEKIIAMKHRLFHTS